MSPSTSFAANATLQPEQEEYLAAWACPRWAKTRGVSVRLGKNITFGGTGDFRLSNFGLGLASCVGLEAAVQIASGGSRSLGFFGGSAAMLLGSKLAAAFSGSSAAWRRAKKQGKGNCAAFSVLSRRCAHSLLGHMTPNVVGMAYLAMAVPTLGSAFLADRAPKTGPFAKIGSLSQASAIALSGSLDRWGDRFQAMDNWKFSHRLSSALLDGYQLLGDEIYSQLAMMRANSRWNADSETANSEDFSPTEKMFQSRLAKLVSSARNNSENLSRCLEIIQVAEIPAWHRPAPGMPDLTDLAASLLAWQRLDPIGDLDAISATIDGMAAIREAHEIQSSLSVQDEPQKMRSAQRL